MRIIGGTARGRRIKSPPGRLRPTSDRVREALFSIVQRDIGDADFLDLYAGSGAVGLEALSRGAKRVVFVEDNARRARAIEAIVADFGWTGRAVVRRMSARHFLDRNTRAFDIVFVDPPYHSDELAKLLTATEPSRHLRPGGTLVIEHFTALDPGPPAIAGLSVRAYRYGDTTLSVYRKTSGSDHNEPAAAD